MLNDEHFLKVLCVHEVQWDIRLFLRRETESRDDSGRSKLGVQMEARPLVVVVEDLQKQEQRGGCESRCR